MGLQYCHAFLSLGEGGRRLYLPCTLCFDLGENTSFVVRKTLQGKALDAREQHILCCSFKTHEFVSTGERSFGFFSACFLLAEGHVESVGCRV